MLSNVEGFREISIDFDGCLDLLRELLPTFDCPLLRPHPLEIVEGSSASALPVVSQKLNVWTDRW